MGWTSRTRFEDKDFGERVARLDVFCPMEDVYGYVSYSIASSMILINNLVFLTGGHSGVAFYIFVPGVYFVMISHSTQWEPIYRSSFNSDVI